MLHPETRRAAQDQLGAEKTGRTTRRVRQTRNTGRRAQPKACARQRSSSQKVLHPEARRAAREQVGAKTNGAHNPKGASNPENRAARTTKSVRPAGEHDLKGASPRNPTHGSSKGAQPGGVRHLRYGSQCVAHGSCGVPTAPRRRRVRARRAFDVRTDWNEWCSRTARPQRVARSILTPIGYPVG